MFHNNNNNNNLTDSKLEYNAFKTLDLDQSLPKNIEELSTEFLKNLEAQFKFKYQIKLNEFNKEVFDFTCDIPSDKDYQNLKNFIQNSNLTLAKQFFSIFSTQIAVNEATNIFKNLWEQFPLIKFELALKERINGIYFINFEDYKQKILECVSTQRDISEKKRELLGRIGQTIYYNGKKWEKIAQAFSKPRNNLPDSFSSISEIIVEFLQFKFPHLNQDKLNQLRDCKFKDLNSFKTHTEDPEIKNLIQELDLVLLSTYTKKYFVEKYIQILNKYKNESSSIHFAILCGELQSHIEKAEKYLKQITAQLKIAEKKEISSHIEVLFCKKLGDNEEFEKTFKNFNESSPSDNNNPYIPKNSCPESGKEEEEESLTSHTYCGV